MVHGLFGNQLADCQRILVLDFITDRSRFCGGLIADVSFPSGCVAKFPIDQVMCTALPVELMLDNDPGGISEAMFGWSELTRVSLAIIE